jgi:hypothetical protein
MSNFWCIILFHIGLALVLLLWLGASKCGSGPVLSEPLRGPVEDKHTYQALHQISMWDYHDMKGVCVKSLPKYFI